MTITQDMADASINSTNNNHTTPNPEIEVRFIAYLVLTILSTFANSLVIITFIVEKSLRTTFNIFILNLAIMDLLTSIFRMGFKTLILGQAMFKEAAWVHD